MQLAKHQYKYKWGRTLIRQVTHSCGIYWHAASTILSTPNQAAQIRAWCVLWLRKTIVTTAPRIKNAALATVTETAVRNVGGLYSECRISDGRGMWWECSCCDSWWSFEGSRGVGKYSRKRMITIENMSHCRATWIIPKDWTKHVHFVCTLANYFRRGDTVNRQHERMSFCIINMFRNAAELLVPPRRRK